MLTPLAALAAKPVPAFCTSGTGVLTPAQWKACWNAGWTQPVTNAANAGTFTGHSVAPFLILGAIIGLILIAVSKSRSSTPAANSN